MLGIYPCALVLPHPIGSLSLDVELLVLSSDKAPYQMILGRDVQVTYAMNLVTPSDPSKDSYVQVGKCPQRYAVLDGFRPTPSTITDVLHASEIATQATSEIGALEQPPPFQSVRGDVRYSDFLRVLNEPRRHTSPEFEKELENANISETLSPKQKEDLIKVICSAFEVFAIPDQDYPFVPLGEPVHLEVNVPSPMPKGLKKAPYPLSNKTKKDIRDAVQSYLRKGQIRPSSSPYAAPTFAVYRGDKVRVIHDWREINALMKVPAHPLPNMQAIIRDLRQAKYLTSVDIMDAFFCMELDEESKKFTAFVTEDGLWEWNVCSFGLASFPGEFQNRMNHVFQTAIFANWLKVYIDDLLLNHKEWHPHLWGIYIVLHTLRALSCHVKMKKAFFGFPEITYVGHKLNGMTLALDESRVSAVKDWPTPTSRAQLRRFLGFTGYHQQFVPKYAEHCVPLFELLGSRSDWKWTARHEDAVSKLKDALCQAIVLYMPDFERPFVVYTDASDVGLAAALYQADDKGIEQPIVFISRKLKDTETRYGASNLECLAVVWMLDKLHFYLDGAQFTVVTDCIAVRSLLTAKWTHRQLIRWQAAIQAFRGRMTIKHRTGTLNDNADGPSRAPLANDRSNPAADLDPDQSIEIGGITLVSSTAPALRLAPLLFGEGGQAEPSSGSANRVSAYLYQEAIEPDSWSPMPISTDGDVRLASITTSGLSSDFAKQLKEAYAKDKVFAVVLEAVSDNTKTLKEVKSTTTLPPTVVKDLNAGRFFVLDDLLYRRDGLTSALVVPDVWLQTQILDMCHDHLLSGHQGGDRTYARIKSVAWWPAVRRHCDAYVLSCTACQLAKRRTGKPPGMLQEIEVPRKPWDIIHMDFVTSLPPARDGVNAVLLVTCRMTKSIVLVPTTSHATAVEVAQHFYVHALPRIGVPRIIISDRDPKFESDFWQSLHQLFGTKLAMSTAHHPQTDGLAERAISSLEEALRTFCAFGSTQWAGDIAIDWLMVLPAWEFAYNSSKHATTGQVPYILERGYCPRTPADTMSEAVGLKSLKVDLKERQWARAVKDAQSRAIESIQHAFNYTKSRWDKSHKEVAYQPGDEVRLSSKFFDFIGTQNKLKPAWIGPFVVKSMRGPNAVEVDLPEEYRSRHPVFPVSLTELHRSNPDIFSSRREHTPQYPAVEQDDQGQDLWEIDFIRRERTKRTAYGPVKEYLVHWKGWDVSHDSWVPEQDLQADDAMEAFRLLTSRRKRK